MWRPLQIFHPAESERPSDFAGWQFWLNKLNEFNGNFINAEMVKAFITSGEYTHRFGTCKPKNQRSLFVGGAYSQVGWGDLAPSTNSSTSHMNKPSLEACITWRPQHPVTLNWKVVQIPEGTTANRLVSKVFGD